MRKIYLLLVIVFFSTCKSSQVSQTDDLKLLRETDKDQAEACSTKDLDRLMSFYEEGAFGIMNTNSIRGKENLRKFWEGAFLMTDFSLTWQLEDAYISESGDLGYTSGLWQQQFSQEGKLITSSGKYLTIWHKQKDGTWKEIVGKP